MVRHVWYSEVSYIYCVLTTIAQADRAFALVSNVVQIARHTVLSLMWRSTNGGTVFVLPTR